MTYNYRNSSSSCREFKIKKSYKPFLFLIRAVKVAVAAVLNNVLEEVGVT